MNHDAGANNGRQWWVERWLELLDSYRFKKRLERARNYAREGNVLSLSFQGAELLAQVQGSEVQPYQVSLWLDPFNDEDWQFVVASLAEKALYSAQLLSGQMPATIEQVFIKNGLNLFPYTLGDVHSRCSCPDKANPCKHIGAVYYQLADRFSEDPFVIFQLRGRSRSQILAALRDQRQQTQTSEYSADSTPTIPATSVAQTSSSASEPKDSKQDTLALIQAFWRYDRPPETDWVVIAPPGDVTSLLDLLGPLPLPYETAQEAKQALVQIYNQVSQQALTQALGSD
ncbi:SWIM zinc finger family protein [Synechocystis sp. LKSZ1]|uniref:SWIM zinc finger family protein n=1 Tax=Synechocystis sp. LKSZ1 TaxID=3144951 RepID=UPI00336C22D4